MRLAPPPWLSAFARRVLSRRLASDRVEEALGDLTECWDQRRRLGRRHLRIAYLRDLASLSRRAGASSPAVARVAAGVALGHDVRYAFRLIRRQPAFAALTVLTLALGIAASTGIFTTVDRLLLRPLPYPAADQLVSISHPPFSFAGGRMDASPRLAGLGAFSAFGLYAEGGLNVDGGGEPRRVKAAVAAPGFLQAMGVTPQAGRLYTADDDQLGANFVAVISDGLWRRHFGADPALVGRRVSLNGRGFLLLGIMPRGFAFPGGTDVWIPVFADRQATGEAFAPEVIARLAPGVTIEAANARLLALHRERGNQDDADLPRALPLQAQLTTTVRPTLWLLGCAVALVLLTSAANVAGLLLSRVTRRHAELAVRRALGATRGRVARLLGVEALVLTSIAGVIGTAGALVALRIAASMTPPVLGGLEMASPDARMLVIAFATSGLTAAIFGVVPAAVAATTATVPRVSASVTGGRPARWLRQTLVAAQVAAALVLVTTTVAAIGTMVRLAGADLGFASPRAVGFTVTLPMARYETPAAASLFFDRAAERLRALPGVTKVAGTGVLPGDTRTGVGVRLERPDETRPADAAPRFARMFSASSDYFSAMGIRLVRGRPFAPADSQAAPAVAILSESAVRSLWPDGANPIGRRIEARFGRPTSMEIIGVVADVRLLGPEERGRAEQVYRPIHQLPPFGSMSFVVDTDGRQSAGSIESAIRAAMAEVDAALPVDRIEPIAIMAGRFLADRRVAASLLGAFGMLTLLLASVGLYAVLSQLVSQRTKEFAIRTALGADPRRLLRGVLGNGLRLAVAGLLAGAAATGLAARLIARFVPVIDAPQPLAIAANMLLVAAVAVVAVWLPARRATRVDPLIAFKAD